MSDKNTSFGTQAPIPDALTELALHCESKRRRLEAIADRLSGYESLKNAPRAFLDEADHYRSFGQVLRRVQARRRPVLRFTRPGALPPGEHGTDVTIEQSFRDVMRMRLRDRDRELIRAGYQSLLAAVRSVRASARPARRPTGHDLEAFSRRS